MRRWIVSAGDELEGAAQVRGRYGRPVWRLTDGALSQLRKRAAWEASPIRPVTISGDELQADNQAGGQALEQDAASSGQDGHRTDNSQALATTRDGGAQLVSAVAAMLAAERGQAAERVADVRALLADAREGLAAERAAHAETRQALEAEREETLRLRCLLAEQLERAAGLTRPAEGDHPSVRDTQPISRAALRAIGGG